MENVEKIICLDIIEHIRKRPGLYIANTMGGNNMEDGVYSLLREILENSLDEIKAGYGNKIDITVRGNTFLLRDFGRGIPLESLPMVITQVHSSGKFDHSVYQQSIGMHGLGLKVVSALSEHFYCKTIRNGQYRKLVTQRGRVLEDTTDIAREPDGCEIFFQPDPVIFENLQIKMLAIEKMLKKYCSANQALQVNFNGKELKCIHGLIDLLVDMVDFGTMVGEPLYLQCGDLECVISQNETASSQWFSFVNGHPTGNGGVHVDAVKSALWQAANKIMKGEHHMKPEDLFATVSGIVSVNVDNPEFEAQTKNRLGNVKLFRNWQILVQDEILNYWFTDSDQCESFFQQVDRNIEKRERAEEKCSSVRNNNNL